MKSILTLVVFGLVAGTAQAATSYDYRNDAKKIERAIDQGDLAGQTEIALDNLIATGVRALRADGKNKEADRIELEWKLHFQNTFAATWDLGDHAPIFPWLEKVYKDLEKFLGEGMMRSWSLYDLHVLNLALPVVFNPMGKDWDRAEYRKHFVPLAGVITFWGVYYGCRYVIPWQMLARICSPAAGAARWWMESSAGFRLADRVYSQFVTATL